MNLIRQSGLKKLRFSIIKGTPDVRVFVAEKLEGD